jgi:hypothetical protein
MMGNYIFDLGFENGASSGTLRDVHENSWVSRITEESCLTIM